MIVMARGQQAYPVQCVLVGILIVSLLVHDIACKAADPQEHWRKSIGPNEKRTSSNCRCQNNGKSCTTNEDGRQVCQCPEGYQGPLCQYDCQGVSSYQCEKLYSLENCGRHYDWMQHCCENACSVNPCVKANPLICKEWIISEKACKKNRKWMKACCGLCHECKDKHPIQCPFWQKKNECVKNERWMAMNCMKSCGLC